MKATNLIMVTSDNNNKFYNMSENNDGTTFTINYGRVGAKGQSETYPMSKWSSIYSQKTKKGYQDVTSLKSTTVTASFKDITNKEVAKLLADLNKYSKQSILDNYTVSSEQVTEAQVNKAQEILDNLSLNLTKLSNQEIDAQLTKLYTIIPRKMKNVKDFIMNGFGTFQTAKKLVTQEQEALDVMKGQIATQATSNTSNSTLEDVLGVKISKVEDSKIIDEVKKLMDNESNRLVNVFEVIKFDTQSKFESQKPKSVKNWTKLLWHGSRNENWLNILKTGLMIRPTCAVITGAMFGNGIYFADKCIKSIGYTSAQGSLWAKGNSKQAFLALYEVNTGMEYRVSKHDSSFYSYDFNTLQSKGKFDSLFAEKGADLKNNEYIVYKSEQCTIKYFVEIK